MSYSIKNDKNNPKNDLLTLLFMFPVWICLMPLAYLIYKNFNAVIAPLIGAFNPDEFLIAIMGIVLIIALLSIPIIVTGITLFLIYKLIKYVFSQSKDALESVIFNDNDLKFIYKDSLLNFNCKYDEIEKVTISVRKAKYILPRKGIANTSNVEIPSMATIEFTFKKGNVITLETHFIVFNMSDPFEEFKENIQPFLEKFENVKYEID